MLSRKFNFYIQGLGNAIACGFCRTFPVGKCGNQLFILTIFSVIGKVQFVQQKRVKQGRHRGGYQQRERCVPFRRTNSVIMPSISITSLCSYAELQESSISRLSWSFVKEFAVQRCACRHRITKVIRATYGPDRIGVGLVKSLNQGLWLHIRIHFTPLNQ